MKGRSLIFLLLLYSSGLNAQLIIRGYVAARDSSGLPFAYIINKSSGNGTMTDHEGRFSLSTNSADTLICSYVGYAKTRVPVRDLKADNKGQVHIIMEQLPVELSTVNVTSFRIKPYEREYMSDIIDRSRILNRQYVGNPVTALYMQFSREGRQVQKLAKIFEQILIEEQVQKKLSREILVKLTGDEQIDYNAFRKYCYYVNDYFIVTHDGVDLYQKVMECYRRWKAEGRDQPLRLREENGNN